MATVSIESSLHTPGSWQVSSDNPAVLAGVCDALTNFQDTSGMVMMAWALHPHEQDSAMHLSYQNELQELGPTALTEVIELPRPRQQNVVWIDRYHFVAAAASPQSGSRLLGLYVGTAGAAAIAVHHPSVSGSVHSALSEAPQQRHKAFEEQLIVDQCMFIIIYNAKQPSSVTVRSPQARVAESYQALQKLHGAVSSW